MGCRFCEEKTWARGCELANKTPRNPEFNGILTDRITIIITCILRVDSRLPKSCKSSLAMRILFA
jgi:hypothetical protein